MENEEFEVSHKSNAPVVIGGTLAVIIIIAGILFYATTQGGKSPTTETAQPGSTASSFEEEIEAIDIESNDSDFADIDADLQNL